MGLDCWYISYNVLYSFSFCANIELYMRYFTTQKKANIIACIGFQLFFITNSLLVLNGTQEECKNNLEFLYGYFFYDTMNLLLNIYESDMMYVVHHIASLSMLKHAILMELNEPYYATMVALIAEFQNPILNLKDLIQDFPALKRLNKLVLYNMYLVFRILLFPLYSMQFLHSIKGDLKLFMIFLGIYSMSLKWFLTMRRKFKIKNVFA